MSNNVSTSNDLKATPADCPYLLAAVGCEICVLDVTGHDLEIIQVRNCQRDANRVS